MPFFGNKRRDFSIQPPRQQVDGTPFFVTDSANIDFTLDNLNLTADLTFTGVTAGTYGDATNIPVLQIDQWGRVTGVTLQPISPSGLALETNGTANTSQTILNLTSGTDIQVVDLGGGVVQFNYTGTGGTYTANNGITAQAPALTNFQLGGNLVKNTTVNGVAYTYDMLFKDIRLFRVNSSGKSWIENTTFPGVVNSVLIDSQLSAITADVNSGAYRAFVSVDGDSTTGSELVRLISKITYPGGFIGFGAYKIEPSAAYLEIRTPNVNAGTATVGQVLALSALNGEVEYINALGNTYTVNNGLSAQTVPSANPNNFQLGGATLGTGNLVRDTYITNDGYAFRIDQINTETGLRVEHSGTGTAIYSQSLDGEAVRALSTNGLAFEGSSTLNYTQALIRNNSDNFSSLGILKLERNTSGISSGNIGGSIDFWIEARRTGSPLPPAPTDPTVSLSAIWEIPGPAVLSRLSRFDIYGYSNGGALLNASVRGDGKFYLYQYGINTFAGTPAYALGVDASGNVVEFTATGTGTVSSISPGTGLAVSTDPNPITTTGSISLNSKLAPADNLTGNAGKFLRVNTGETAVEYVSAPTGTVTSVNAGTNISVTGTVSSPIINSLSDRYKTSSTTSNSVSNGVKTFTVDADLSYIPLQEVLVVYDPANHMHGEVVSYSGTTLVVNIKNHTGSGTYTSWVINLDGTPVDAITGSGTINELAYFTGTRTISSFAVSGDATLSNTGQLTIKNNLRTGTFGVTVDGVTGVVQVGTVGYVVMPYDGTITGWSITANVSGNIQFDIWKATNAIPTVANTIIPLAANRPKLTAQQYVNSTTVTGWTTSFLANDVYGFYVDSASTIKNATLTIRTTKS